LQPNNDAAPPPAARQRAGTRVLSNVEGPALPAARRVLGVDPGTVALGWGIVDGCGQHIEHVASGVIRARGTRAERLAEICDVLGDISARFTPIALSLEQTFVGDNVQSAFRLGEARGAVMVAACRAHLEVAEYSPAEIKVAVAGSGRATKAQMQTMVARLLGVATALAADEADALGAAICHLYAARFAALVGAAAGWGGRAPRGRTASRARRRPGPELVGG
jgi:crossover junction endodeoxyribonuclease RuvC